jgi:hypothetical protein
MEKVETLETNLQELEDFGLIYYEQKIGTRAPIISNYIKEIDLEKDTLDVNKIFFKYLKITAAAIVGCVIVSFILIFSVKSSVIPSLVVFSDLIEIPLYIGISLYIAMHALSRMMRRNLVVILSYRLGELLQAKKLKGTNWEPKQFYLSGYMIQNKMEKIGKDEVGGMFNFDKSALSESKIPLWLKTFFHYNNADKSFERKEIKFRITDKMNAKIKKELNKQGLSRRDSHDFTLQFLNRIMFIYFISKKRWLNNNPKFMRWIWNRYLTERNIGKTNKDSFYDKWLEIIFFEAFNNRFSESKYLPNDVKEILLKAPYLNGGLFTKNELDNLSVKIDDALFKKIFEFFEKYNFTIREDSPIDIEVAVNPQMIGYVYESLAFVAEEIYDRTDFGIFYTPKVEVDFMCRRSIVEYLSKNLNDIPKEIFYEFVFSEEKNKTEDYFENSKLWYKLEEVLDNLSAVDPACGSGAFLVGVLNVLSELYKVVYKHIERTMTDFEMKKRIIGRNLYGVDVMAWAIGAAELRLWLQLIVETELDEEYLRTYPLLPNLNLNLRVGDSLVQEIGGMSLHLRDPNVSQNIRKKLLQLKSEKEKFYNNDPTAKFKRKEQMVMEEIRVFMDIIDDRISTLKREKELLNQKLNKLGKEAQRDLIGNLIKVSEKEVSEIRERLDSIDKEIDNLSRVKENLDDPTKKPFVWEIDFAEIFGDKGGFDIVIGNPPYIRQEKISPPNKMKDEVTLEDRRDYKEKLINSVKSKFPVIENIDRKSDYYIYFYFHGLSLLNDKGTFCFITSNSWLDVGYGKELQEFLLKYASIIAIYDNPKRSFAHADVNTIIALFGFSVFKEEKVEGLKVVGSKNWSMLSHTAKFVKFKKPFEEVLSAKNLIEIDEVKVNIKGKGITGLVKNVAKTNDYRIFPVLQEDLLEDGWDYPENYKNGRFKAGKYQGNKWGVKYIRAPDIFYTILEKGNRYIRRIGDLGKVRYPIKTGINEFFYIDKKENDNNLHIEEEFLTPIIKSSKEVNKILIDTKNLNSLLFTCNKSKLELKKLGKRNALKYIEWGEKQVTKARQKTEAGIPWPLVPSVQGRRFWYSVETIEPPDIICNRFFGERFFYGLIEDQIIEDQTFYGILLKKEFQDKKRLLCILLNTTLQFLLTEMTGRSGLGEGVLQFARYEMEKNFVYLPDITLKNIDKLLNHEINTIFIECGIDSSKPIRGQKPKPLIERAELDKIIFDALGLTEEERKEVYWSVCELVKQRLEKARSLEND